MVTPKRTAKRAPEAAKAPKNGEARKEPKPASILVIDVGGTKLKILATGQTEPRRARSGPTMTPQRMVEVVRELAGDWQYDAVSIGLPCQVGDHGPRSEPGNLGPGWVGFNFAAGFERPVRIVNDAAMQALGGYNGGKMLFLGFGTGLGTTLVVDGTLVPMELAHLPYKKATFEDYVGEHALLRDGKKKWRKHCTDVIVRLMAALEPEDVVLGGGNAVNLGELPPRCRIGANANAFPGGFRMWADQVPGKARKTVKRVTRKRK
jgi:polyphosphate glucokinase